MYGGSYYDLPPMGSIIHNPTSGSDSWTQNTASGFPTEEKREYVFEVSVSLGKPRESEIEEGVWGWNNPQAHFVRRGRANKPVVSPSVQNGRGKKKGGQLADQIFGWGVPQVVHAVGEALRRSPRQGTH